VLRRPRGRHARDARSARAFTARKLGKTAFVDIAGEFISNDSKSISRETLEPRLNAFGNRR